LFTSLSKVGAERGLLWSEIGLLLVSAVVAAGLIGEYRKSRDERWKGLSDTFELMVIIGVVGEIVFDGLIFGFSGRLSVIQDAAVAAATAEAGRANEAAAEANKVAGIANEAAGIANERAETYRAQNNAFEAKYGPLVEKGLRAREVDEDELRHGMRGVKRGNLTIVRLDDAEPRNLADSLGAALRRIDFKVKTEDLKGTSPLTGVIVCERGSNDLKLVKALNRARLGAKLMRLKARDRPDFCDAPIGGPESTGLLPPLFGHHSSPDRGTVILVGQRPLPPQP
jgi:hypothetical protein